MYVPLANSHIVLVANGLQDGMCAGQAASFGGRRIYNGGNERVPVRMNSKMKYGIDLANSRLSGQGEVMSESAKPMTVRATLRRFYQFANGHSTGVYDDAV
jgi:hypothetical protein